MSTKSNPTKSERLKRRKPCPDGRSSMCTGLMPEGYHRRCPECWREVQTVEGLYEGDAFRAGLTINYQGD